MGFFKDRKFKKEIRKLNEKEMKSIFDSQKEMDLAVKNGDFEKVKQMTEQQNNGEDNLSKEQLTEIDEMFK